MNLRFILLLILVGAFVAFIWLAIATGTTLGVIALGVLVALAATGLWTLDHLVKLAARTWPEDRR